MNSSFLKLITRVTKKDKGGNVKTAGSIDLRGTSHVNKLLSGKQCCNSKCLSCLLSCEEIEECLSVFWDKTEEE